MNYTATAQVSSPLSLPSTAAFTSRLLLQIQATVDLTFSSSPLHHRCWYYLFIPPPVEFLSYIHTFICCEKLQKRLSLQRVPLQLSSGSTSVTIASCNYLAPNDPTTYKGPFTVVNHILTRHPLTRALVAPPPTISVCFLEETVLTATRRGNNLFITLTNGMEVSLDKIMFAIALDLPIHDIQLNTRTQSEFITMFYSMGYEYLLESPSQFRKGHISPLWHYVIHFCIRCLTGKTGGTDQHSKPLIKLIWGLYTSKQVDNVAILFEDFLSYLSAEVT